MWVNNLPKVATQRNSGTTRESNPGIRAWIPSALTTEPHHCEYGDDVQVCLTNKYHRCCCIVLTLRWSSHLEQTWLNSADGLTNALWWCLAPAAEAEAELIASNWLSSNCVSWPQLPSRTDNRPSYQWHTAMTHTGYRQLVRMLVWHYVINDTNNVNISRAHGIKLAQQQLCQLTTTTMPHWQPYFQRL